MDMAQAFPDEIHYLDLKDVSSINGQRVKKKDGLTARKEKVAVISAELLVLCHCRFGSSANSIVEMLSL